MTKQELLKTAKPMLFNTEMVQATLDGRKTSTRRLIKPQPKLSSRFIDGRIEEPIEYPIGHVDIRERANYKVGDILYVRETVCKYDKDHIIDGEKYAYKANSTEFSEEIRKSYGYQWRPSIHMPKEAARIFLRVTDVRVERLQDIENGWNFAEEGIVEEHGFRSEMVNDFMNRWDSTIKKQDLEQYGWEANPWVWVYKFKRVNVDE